MNTLLKTVFEILASIIVVVLIIPIVLFVVMIILLIVPLVILAFFIVWLFGHEITIKKAGQLKYSIRWFTVTEY